MSLQLTACGDTPPAAPPGGADSTTAAAMAAAIVRWKSMIPPSRLPADGAEGPDPDRADAPFGRRKATTPTLRPGDPLRPAGGGVLGGERRSIWSQANF